ncbi:MAG TPA: 50S ribosomal protein L29 [Planctomycetes bacterium]|nr:50S ribosomal protein L29 [Planctomycetota bacterium]|tara:strand:+ start:251 stop:463 length:213 start_codon:yes stop_codon:yes gene_type:complete
MKTNEIRGKDDSEILFDIGESEKEMFQMKFRSLTEGNTDPAKIRRLRRDIGRMKTILREREKGIRGQEPR